MHVVSACILAVKIFGVTTVYCKWWYFELDFDMPLKCFTAYFHMWWSFWLFGHFGTCVELTSGHVGTGTEVSGHFGIIPVVLKYLDAKCFQVRSICLPWELPD